MTAIGSMYRDAKGSRRDYKSAMEWYLRAATAKNWTAAYNIGTLYRCGWGVEPDYAQAMAWFRKGADNGHARSMFGIATLHRRGEGVMTNAINARDWYQKAYALGLEAAKPWATTPIARWGALGRKRGCLMKFPDD
jgi:TPR repeat protein